MRRQILLDAPAGKIKERTSESEMPNEYECCYCESKVPENKISMHLLILLHLNYYYFAVQRIALPQIHSTLNHLFSSVLFLIIQFCST